MPCAAVPLPLLSRHCLCYPAHAAWLSRSFLPRSVDYSFKLIYLCWRQLLAGGKGCDKGRQRSAKSFLYKLLRSGGEELFSCHENRNKPILVLEKALFAQLSQYRIGGRFLLVQLLLADPHQFTRGQRCVMPH